MDHLPLFPSPENAPRGIGMPVVISSRARLFRNLHNIPFLEQMGKEEQLAVAESLNRALDQLADFSGGRELCSPFSKFECAGMLEKRRITPEFAQMRFAGAMIRLTGNAVESALINGGDHLVLNNDGTGLVLCLLRERLNTLETELSRHIRFAFHPKYGYLSPDPSHAGTGLELTVILHLPGLALLDEVKPMLTALYRLGLKCRGILDTENKFPGNLYVISNLSKMGETEEQLTARLEKTVMHIVEEELDARNQLLRKMPVKVHDFCYRSIAVLKHARMISSTEAFNALSGLRLAQECKIAAELIPADLPDWDMLLQGIMPNVVASKLPDPEHATKEQRAFGRAEYLRKAFERKEIL